jgi:hypothetical protein
MRKRELQQKHDEESMKNRSLRKQYEKIIIVGGYPRKDNAQMMFLGHKGKRPHGSLIIEHRLGPDGGKGHQFSVEDKNKQIHRKWN